MSKKDKLVGYYFAEGKELIKVNIFKQKNKICQKKTAVLFMEDIKLCHMFLDEYNTRVHAIKRSSNRIETPQIKSRIETLDDEKTNGFTIKSDILNSWLDKL